MLCRAIRQREYQPPYPTNFGIFRLSLFSVLVQPLKRQRTQTHWPRQLLIRPSPDHGPAHSWAACSPLSRTRMFLMHVAGRRLLLKLRPIAVRESKQPKRRLRLKNSKISRISLKQIKINAPSKKPTILT